MPQRQHDGRVGDLDPFAALDKQPHARTQQAAEQQEGQQGARAGLEPNSIRSIRSGLANHP